jgi:hypothetical protein
MDAKTDESRGAVAGQVERSVRRDDWRAAYCDAYRAANGREAQVLESAAGWFRVRTDEGHETGIQYRRKQIELMTAKLRARAQV